MAEVTHAPVAAARVQSSHARVREISLTSAAFGCRREQIIQVLRRMLTGP